MVESIATLIAFLVCGFARSFLVDLNFVELGLVLALPFCGRLLLLPWFDNIEQRAATFAQRRTLCIVLAFAAPIVLRLALLPWHPVPTPWIPDEFSHLLIADTLSHGRFANPTHPLWQHFETVHVFFQPVYASTYFPALALFMALGKLFGSYWIGILLSSGFMCAALLWMLYGLFPARWALLGGALAVIRWGAASYWVNSYWGGTVPAAAGALVLGGYVRLRRKFSLRSSIALASGLVLLAWSRPFEGCIFALPIGIALLWTYRKKREFVRMAAPIVLIAGIGLGALGAYCKAITGSPFIVPYRVNQKIYGWPLTLPWQHPAPVVYRHNDLRLYDEWERCVQYRKVNLQEAVKFSSFNLAPVWRFYFGPALTIPLFGMWRWRGDRRIRIVFACAICSLAVGAAIAAYPHYLAPATACFLALIVQGFRHLRARTRRSDKNGLALSRIAVTACVAMLAVRVFVNPAVPGVTAGEQTFAAFGADQGIWRANILRRLESMPGRHAVFVQYNRLAFLTAEWVYNEANIDASKIIWAQDMGPEKNREVLRYYPDRQFWLVRPDDAPEELLHYEPALARAEMPRAAGKEICPSLPPGYVDSKLHSPPKPLAFSSRIF